MSNYDKIKEMLEKKKLSQTLLFALSNSLKIKLTTIDQKGQKIETKINLLKGISTEVSNPYLLKNDNNTFKFHQKQLKEIYSLWDKNRETLVKILQIINGNSIEFNQNFEEKLLEDSDNFDDESNMDEDIDLSIEIDTENIDSETPENWVDETEENQEEENMEVEIENSFSEDMDFEDNDFNNEDDFDSLTEDIASEDEENIFDDNQEENVHSETGENWDNLMGEMSEEEAIVSAEIDSNEEEVSPDLEANEDDWEEWLEDEENSSNNTVEYNPDEIEWEEENWQEETK